MIPDSSPSSRNGRLSRLSERWFDEPDMGRMVNGIPYQLDRVARLGNAVVPQVAQFIGERILASDRS
jgi:hypothetical protein